MLVALLTITPLGLMDAIPTFTQPRLLLAGIGVGICSSVIPYVCDQLAMARIPRATFALLLSLLPACATLMGIVVLRQLPATIEWAGIFLVGMGVAVHQEAVTAPGPKEIEVGTPPELSGPARGAGTEVGARAASETERTV